MNHGDFQSPEFRVPHGAGLVFSDNTLQITDNRDNMTEIEGLPT